MSSESKSVSEVRATHILVKHKNSRNPKSWKEKKVTRSKEEAIAKIKGFREDIVSSGKPYVTRFMEIAQEESHCGSAREGGDLGIFGKGQMQKAFEDAAFGLEVGEMSDVVDSASGIHIILRLPCVNVSHILVKHKQSRNPKSWKENPVTRSKEEAIEKIKGFREEIIASGKPYKKKFFAIAKTESHCGSARNGGALGMFGKGQMQQAFEDAAFALEVGEISDVVDSASGIHIILRIE